MATEPLQLATLTGIQAFQPCYVDDTAYTAADLKSMAANWSEFKDRMEPPVVVGHEEEQHLVKHLSNTGSPAVGWISKVDFAEAPDRNGKVRPVLLTDAKEVHPVLADAVNNKRYKKVSIEPWRRPPEQVFDGRDHILSVLAKRGLDSQAALSEAKTWAAVEHARLTTRVAEGKLAKAPSMDWLTDYRLRDKLGPMLRRMAVLGGEVSRLGTLTDLPEAVFSDRRRDGLSTDEQWEQFMADTATADKPASGASGKKARLVDSLGKLNFPDEVVEALSAMAHEKLQSVVLASLEQAAGLDAPAATATEEAAETPAEEAQEDAGTPTPEQMVADLVALGYDEADLAGMSPEDLLALWKEEKGATMSAAKPVKKRQVTPAPDAAFAARLAANEARLKAQEERLAAQERATKLRVETERKRIVEGVIADATKGSTPKLIPAMVDRYKRRLMEADMTEVRKFGDRECTAFEDVVDEINSLPPVRFFAGEKVPQGGRFTGLDGQIDDYVKRHKRPAKA